MQLPRLAWHEEVFLFENIVVHAPITVNGSSGTPEQNNDLAKKMAREMESSMRGVVMDEIRRASRPGNMLNNRR